MYCPKCGKELPEGFNFCPNCGNSISSSSASPQPQTSSNHDQDIPSTERQSIPPVPDEKVKCPKCGATGCTPQYKQNISGGGYGCCSGGLGALILGPLGLLCGACGRSVKTTNDLVWICPKCGHEFRAQSDMYKLGIFGFSFSAVIMAVFALFAKTLDAEHKSGFSGLFPMSILCALMCASMIALYAYSSIYKYPFACTDEQKKQLKLGAAIAGIIVFICFLFSVS